MSTYKTAEATQAVYKTAERNLRDAMGSLALLGVLGTGLYARHRLERHFDERERRLQKAVRAFNGPKLLITQDRPEKKAGFPTEQAKRPRVSGLKVPRVATPRLGTGTPEGKIPSNPFRGNWVKLKRPAPA